MAGRGLAFRAAFAPGRRRRRHLRPSRRRAQPTPPRPSPVAGSTLARAGRARRGFKQKGNAADKHDEDGGDPHTRTTPSASEKGFPLRASWTSTRAPSAFTATHSTTSRRRSTDGKAGSSTCGRGQVVFWRVGERAHLPAAGWRWTSTRHRLLRGTPAGLRVARGVRGGQRIERVDDDTYRIEGGTFTSCAQPTPRWSFSAGSARLEVEDKIVAQQRGVPGQAGAGLLHALLHVPHPERPALHRLPDAPRRLLLVPRLQRGRRVLLGHGPQLRPDLLRRQLLRLRLRPGPRVPLRAGRAVQGIFRTYALPSPGRRTVGLRPRLERAADAAGEVPGYAAGAPVQRPRLPAADTGQPQPGVHPHAADLVQPDAQLPQGELPGPGRLHGDLLRRRAGRERAPAHRAAQPDRSQDRPQRGGLPVGGPRRAAGLRQPGPGRPLREVRRPAARLAAAGPELPPGHARGGGTLHALRGHRHGRRHRRPLPRPGLRGGQHRHARAHLLACLQHRRELLLGEVQARDRARGHVDLPVPGRRVRPHPEVRRRGLLPGDERAPLLARPAPPGQAARPERQARVLGGVRLAHLPDLLRPDRGQPERVRPQLLVLGLRPRRRPPRTTRRSSPGCASGPRMASRRTSTSSTT
jgi:hypothetical protein